MEKKLKDFYMDCILPELVDPRYPRKIPIRNPQYITEAVRKKMKKSKRKENQPPTIQANKPHCQKGKKNNFKNNK